MEDAFEKVPNWLRYIIAIPVGIICVILGYFLVTLSILWISEPNSLYYNLSYFFFRNFINILLFFYGLNVTLPKYQFRITLILATVLGILYTILIGFSLDKIQLTFENISADILVLSALIISCVTSFKEYYVVEKEKRET